MHMKLFDADMHAPHPTRLMGVAGLGICALVLGGALAFEHIGGLAPCRLCLQQRIPYVVVMVAGVLLCAFPRPRLLPVFLLGSAGALFAGGLVGGYQAGLEWSFWEGACGSMDAPVFELEGFFESLNRPPPPPCDEPAWTLFSISLAGYNALISLGLVSAGLYALGLSMRSAAK